MNPRVFIAAAAVMTLLAGAAAAQQMTLRVDAVEITKFDGSSGTGEKFFDLRGGSTVIQSLKANVTASQFGCPAGPAALRVNLTAAANELEMGENVSAQPAFVEFNIPQTPAFFPAGTPGAGPYYAEKAFKLRVIAPEVTKNLDHRVAVTAHYGGGMPMGCGSASGQSFPVTTGKLELSYRIMPTPQTGNVSQEIPALDANQTTETASTPGFEPLLLLGPLVFALRKRRAR